MEKQENTTHFLNNISAILLLSLVCATLQSRLNLCLDLLA